MVKRLRVCFTTHGINKQTTRNFTVGEYIVKWASATVSVREPNKHTVSERCT